MQAVILAAGKSTRTFPLTLTKPKALLKIANKPIIIHILEQLEGIVDEVILVVGYKKEMIKELLGEEYKGIKLNNTIKLKYAEQKQQLGTGDALLQAELYVKDRFFLLNGDDFVFKEDLKNMLKHELSLLIKEVKNPENFGVVVKEKEGIRIIEKPAKFVGNLANVACYLVDKHIFSYKNEVKKSPRGEFEATDFINQMAKDKKIELVEAKKWIPISYPWDLLDANSHFLADIKKKIYGNVEKNATLKGEVIVGKGTIVKNSSYIEGPVMIGENCTIGPNCYIRPYTTIGNKCRIGNAVEVKNSIIGDNTHISHLSYIGDSIIGNDVNFGAGTIIANLRHDNANIKTFINGRIVDTGRRKLGTICGDGVHTGINTSVYPGRKLFSRVETSPGEIIKEDKVNKDKAIL